MLPMHTGQQELRGVHQFLSHLSAGFLETLMLSRQPRPPTRKPLTWMLSKESLLVMS